MPEWFDHFLHGLLKRKPAMVKLVAHSWQHEVQKLNLHYLGGWQMMAWFFRTEDKAFELSVFWGPFRGPGH